MSNSGTTKTITTTRVLPGDIPLTFMRQDGAMNIDNPIKSVFPNDSQQLDRLMANTITAGSASQQLDRLMVNTITAGSAGQAGTNQNGGTRI